MSFVVTRVGKGGRVVVPSEYRRVLGLEPGEEVIVTLEEDHVRIQRPDQAIRGAQELVRRYVGSGVRLAEELLADRRDEARRDAESAAESEARSGPPGGGDGTPPSTAPQREG